MTKQMCSLTSTQLADVLNYLLGGTSLNRMIVECWQPRRVRQPVEHWCQLVLEDYGVIPKKPTKEGKSRSLILPEMLERFSTTAFRVELIERERRRGRMVAA